MLCYFQNFRVAGMKKVGKKLITINREKTVTELGSKSRSLPVKSSTTKLYAYNFPANISFLCNTWYRPHPIKCTQVAFIYEQDMIQEFIYLLETMLQMVRFLGNHSKYVFSEQLNYFSFKIESHTFAVLKLNETK